MSDPFWNPYCSPWFAKEEPKYKVYFELYSPGHYKLVRLENVVKLNVGDKVYTVGETVLTEAEVKEILYHLSDYYAKEWLFIIEK